MDCLVPKYGFGYTTTLFLPAHTGVGVKVWVIVGLSLKVGLMVGVGLAENVWVMLGVAVAVGLSLNVGVIVGLGKGTNTLNSLLGFVSKPSGLLSTALIT